MRVNNLKLLVKALNMGMFCCCAALPVINAAVAGDSLSQQEIIAREIEHARLSEAERVQRVERFVKLGEEYLRTRQYRAAAEQFTLALSMQPDNAQARKGQEEALRYLESRTGDNLSANKIIDMAKVRSEYSEVEVSQYLSEAMNAYAQTEQAMGEMNPDQKTLLLNKRLELLDKAEEYINRAALRIEGLGADSAVADKQVTVVTMRANIKRKRAAYQAALENLRQSKALETVENEKKVLADVENRRRAAMMAQANDYLEKMELDLAEEIAEELLSINPADTASRDLQMKIRNARLDHRSKVIKDLQKENRANLMLKLEHDAIADVSFSKPIRYPSDWLLMNRKKKVAPEKEMVTKKKEEVRRKLEEAFSFDFVEAPLVEVVLENIRQRTGLNINFASIPEDKAGKEINLTPRNMRLENIFKHVLRQINSENPEEGTNLTYSINDDGIVNFMLLENLAKNKNVVTAIYDIRDLAAAVQDARKMPTSFGDDEEDDNDKEAEESAETIDVKTVICQAYPNDFSDEKGNISYNDDAKKLTVKGTTEQQEKVKELLIRLRNVQNIQVSVSARFLRLRDDFWEQFKSEFYDFNNAGNSSYSAAGARDMSISNGNNSNVNANGWSRNTYLSPENAKGINKSGKFWNEMTGSMFNGSFTGLTNVFGNGRMDNVDSQGMSFAIQQRGWLGDIQSQWFLQMVRKNNRADELFSPHIVVYNNRYGWIRFCKRIPYIENYQQGNGEYGLQPILAYMEDGCSLEVEPCVSSDRKYITVRAQPRIEGLMDINSTRFGVKDDSLTDQYILDLPKYSIYEAKTYATVPDGGAVIMSGLSTNVNGRGRQGVPVLQDLPIIGNAFSNRYYQKSKESYTCLISAKMIILNEEEAAQTGGE